MRILHLDSGREMRGGQWQVLRLMRGLRERGHQQELMCRGGSPLFQAALQENFDLHPLSIGRFPSAARAAELVHAHDARTHAWAALFPRSPIVAARRVGFPIHTGFFSRLKYQRASHFIAVSRYVADVLRIAGVPDSKISVVYDGVPLVREKRARTIPVLTIGKAGDLALAAARFANLPLKTSLNLEKDLPEAAIFLYLTYSEGLGSAVLLAMSAGAAVIASDIGGLPEAITGGHDGVLVENSAEAIAAALRRLSDDRDFARRLAINARHTVEGRFSEHHMVENTIRVYERVLRG